MGCLYRLLCVLALFYGSRSPVSQLLDNQHHRKALFRRVLKDSKTTTTRLTPEAVREIVKKRSQGVPGRVLGYSLRVGSAVSLARGNASLVEMQVDGQMEGFSAAVPLCERGRLPRIARRHALSMARGDGHHRAGDKNRTELSRGLAAIGLTKGIELYANL